MAQIERRLAAIMLADIAGYSSLMERNESRTFERVRTMREELVTPEVARYGGRIIKTTGDGFLAEFSSGTAALLCGIDIQRLNHAREVLRAEDERLHLRIGINLGDIIIDGDDVSGDGVNVAARLEPFAPPDGICVSGVVRDQVREDLDVVFEDMGEQQVKNIARPIRAFRINLADAPIPKVVIGGKKSWRPSFAIIASLVLLSVGGAYYWYQGKATVSQPSVQTASDSQKGKFAGISISSALVIGNGKYTNQEVLLNSGNDAIAIATSLSLRGVPVTLKTDLTEYELVKEIAKFKKLDTGDSVKFFYFAGQGENLDGKNFIFPVNALGKDALRANKGIGQQFAVEDIYPNVRGKMIVLLDTHGDPVSVPENVVLSISGSPKNPAFDSYRLPDGTLSQNSPYVASIIEMLGGSDEDLPAAFLRLSQRVGQKTNGKQITWISSSIVGAISWSRSGAGR